MLCTTEHDSRRKRAEPRTAQDTEQPAQDSQQTLSLNTAQAGQQLGVDSRTVRRYITEGLRNAGGIIVRLEARQVRTNRGPEWQIYQTDLEEFKKERDRAATEGERATQITQPVEQSQALTLSVQILAAELERRGAALAEAQATIERLAREAGHHAGRAEQLEQERDALREQVRQLEAQRAEWQKRANPLYRRRPHAIRLQPIPPGETPPHSSETSTAITQPIARQTTTQAQQETNITSTDGQHAPDPITG